MNVPEVPYQELKEGTGRTQKQDKRKEVLTLEQTLESQKQLSWIKVFRLEHQHRASSDVLGFMMRRVDAAQVKMSHASTGVHIQLVELSTLVLELQTIQIPELDVITAFANQVNALPELCHMPGKDVLGRFFSSLARLNNAELYLDHVMVTLMDLGWVQWRSEDNKTSFEKELMNSWGVGEQSASECLVLAQAQGQAAYEQLSAEYGRHACLKWILDILQNKLSAGSLSGFVADWELKSTDNLPWAAIGSVLIEAIEDECLKESECKNFAGEAATFRKGVRRIHSEVMPHFQLRLTQLKSLLDSQIAMSEQTKAKMLAGFVTVGVSGGQILFHQFMAAGGSGLIGVNSTST